LNKTGLCNYADYEKVDIRIGTILEASVFPEARKPAYKLLIDFGQSLGVKKSSAQITVKYETASLVGMQVAAVVNFPPKQIGPFLSECLVLGAVEGNYVHLLTPDRSCTNGSPLK
jgi:tRNA-binding protein